MNAAEIPVPAWVDHEAYPFRHRWLETPHGRVHYVDEGEGPPILFVHGTPTWSFEYRHLIQALSKTHRCIAPDHLGFGLSARPADFGYRPEDHADVLASFVAALGLRDYTLVVHDFGGPIGLPLALAEESGVARVAVINSWMWSFADDPAMASKARLAGTAIFRWMYRRLNFSLKILTPYAYGDKKKLTPAIHRQYLAVFPTADDRARVLFALAKSMTGSSAFFDGLWARRAPLAARPLCLIWGMKDRAFPPHVFERWRAAFPHASVTAIPTAGHWPHEEAPAEVVGALREFVGIA